MTHTKGPWELNEEENTVSKYRIYTTTDGKNVGWFDPDQETEDQTEANARLIASAPQLLEALIKAKETIWVLSEELNYKSARWQSEHVTPIEQAINKATGQ